MPGRFIAHSESPRTPVSSGALWSRRLRAECRELDGSESPARVHGRCGRVNGISCKLWVWLYPAGVGPSLTQ